MLVVPTSPHSTAVGWKEKLHKARADVDVRAWMLSATVAILAAILSLDKQWPVLVSGLAAGTIVMLMQMVGNFLWRAEPEILRERLVTAYGRLEELERQTTEKVHMLISGVAWAQNIAAVRPDTPVAMEKWLQDLRVFNKFLNDLVAPKLADHEWLRLRHADDDGQLLPGAFDDEHRRESRKLRVRMTAMQALIDENVKHP